MNPQMLTILLDSIQRTGAAGDASPNRVLVYGSWIMIAVAWAFMLRAELRGAQSASYTKNFDRLCDVVWCMALQNSIQNGDNPEHVIHRLHKRLVTFRVLGLEKGIDNKSKLEFFRNVVNELSADDVNELKQNVRKMKLPMLCRGYMIRQLNARGCKCNRQQKQR